jgi:hypothetical protein
MGGIPIGNDHRLGGMKGNGSGPGGGGGTGGGAGGAPPLLPPQVASVLIGLSPIALGWSLMNDETPGLGLHNPFTSDRSGGTGQPSDPDEDDPPTPDLPSKEQVEKLRKEFDRSVRPKFWKNEAASNSRLYTPENLERMRKGRPPIGKDGYPMELHHKNPLAKGGTNDISNIEPMTRTEHRLGPNYKRNHPGP